jgi:hypothetical protein
MIERLLQKGITMSEYIVNKTKKVVYLHLHPITKKPFYVGSGSATRPYDFGLTRNSAWHEIVDEFGFIVKIVDQDVPTRKLALEMEDLLMEMIGLEHLANINTNHALQRLRSSAGGVARVKYRQERLHK